MYEPKLTSNELKKKIMLQQPSFCSRFLDIPLEELCRYTKEQIERMVDNTIEQMPEELLRQFEIEILGGKREL